MTQSELNDFKQQTGAIITIQELLRGHSPEFDAAKSVQLVRHADTRKEKIVGGKAYHETMMDLYRYNNDVFRRYQSEQEKGNFDNTDFIVSFVGERGTLSRFVGVYKVGNKVQNPLKDNEWIIDFQEVEAFRPLKHRVVIDWGKSAVSWRQNYHRLPKAVVRIDEGFEDENGIPRFVSYSDTILSYKELKAIFIHEPQHWKHVLQAVNCIYMIQDKEKPGKQYVGSTYGKDGIWGRWQCYFKTGGHGGNKDLLELVLNDPDYASNFHWIILETMPLAVTGDEAISRENLYKRKFMTREFGYNKN